MKEQLFKEFENLSYVLYTARKNSKDSDSVFATSKRVKDTLTKMLNLLKKAEVSTTYKSLTNQNLHFFVKLLNYNGKFDKELKKELRDELKKLPLLSN